MSRTPPQFVRTWDFWDSDRGCWRGDSSIIVQEAPPASGRMIKMTKEPEVMAEEHNHDTDTMDDFFEDEENTTVKD